MLCYSFFVMGSKSYSQSRTKSSGSRERMMTMDWQSLDPQMLCQLCWKSFGVSAIALSKSEPPFFTSVPVSANLELWMAFKELLQGARFNTFAQLAPIIYSTWIDPTCALALNHLDENVGNLIVSRRRLIRRWCLIVPLCVCGARWRCRCKRKIAVRDWRFCTRN